ncbi:Tyrosinase and Metridin ShK toxin domain containing protein [Aphelenchoides besseyi]|nr:Tyrosinase and Metridin ShK toxin domain containing protein [Aphelenchoides besseyi]
MAFSWLGILAALGTVNAQFDCQLAPGEPWRTICSSFVNWDVQARQIQQEQQAASQNFIVAAPAVPNIPQLSPALPPPRFATTAQGCTNMGCLCPYFRGMSGPNGRCAFSNGAQLNMAVRQEIRTLSDAQRQNLFSAIQQLKNNGQYDQMSELHRQVGSSSGAHSGPGFLPWHREFLKRFEISLRMIDTSLSIPYWDSVLDSYLPRPTDSIFFSSLFMGEQDAFGQVVNGPFSPWRTLEGNSYITRHLGNEGRLFRENDLNNVYRQTQLEQVMAYTVPQSGCPYQPNFGALEYTHSSVHLFIGGDMKPPVTSANDPIFYFHHSFVDLIFENWRQMHQDRFTRETQYPPDLVECANQQHFSNAIMRPFEITNRQGLSNEYTDFMYQYAARPQCPDCGGSAYLFCDPRGNAHCVSKIKLNGWCQGFEGLDACHNGVCINGVCVPGQMRHRSLQQQSRTSPRPATARIHPPTTPRPNPLIRNRANAPRANSLQNSNGRSFARTFNQAIGKQANSGDAVHQAPNPSRSNVRRAPARNRSALTSAFPATTNSQCYNDDPCCAAWARRRECSANSPFMSQYCRRSCGQCHAPQSANQRGCFDRHSSCSYWSQTGECTRRRQFMAENCRAACRWCNISEQKLCANTARMSRM